MMMKRSRIPRDQPSGRNHSRAGKLHAVAQAKKLKVSSDTVVIVNLSGRGDKDVTEVARLMKLKQ
jgi:hypothetical protein